MSKMRKFHPDRSHAHTVCCFDMLQDWAEGMKLELSIHEKTKQFRIYHQDRNQIFQSQDLMQVRMFLYAWKVATTDRRKK